MAMCLFGCAQNLPIKLTDNAQRTELIPRNILFGNPSKAQLRISPDGENISWLAPNKGVLNIWIAPVVSPHDGRVITDFDDAGIGSHSWSADSKYVFYARDKDGDQNDHIFATNIETRVTRDLTPVQDGVQADLIMQSPRRPDDIVVSMNLRDRSVFDLYRVSIATGERTLIGENKEYSSWLVDQNLTPRFGIVEPATGGAVLQTLTGETVLEVPLLDYINTHIIGLEGDTGNILLLDSRDRNYASLVKYDLRNQSLMLLAEGQKADIDSVVFHPMSSSPLAYRENFLKPEWKPLDRNIEQDFEYLKHEVAGPYEITSMSHDLQKWTVFSETSESPGTYYLYDRSVPMLTKLFVKWPALDSYVLQPMTAFEIEARDGLKMVSYLTLPIDSDPDGDGVPEYPVPLVLNVHGGPWSRDDYGYDIIAQWLSNRGYAVLSVNYRGSLGFGKEHLNAGVGEFAGKMHDDLIDAVNWATDHGIADPHKVGIMGGSYGGYAALVGLTFTPDIFACGVDRVGMSNLVTAIESFPEHWKPFLESDWYRFVGNPAELEERADMLARSPITRVNDVKVPLLITQGENDPRVVKAESDQMVAAMEAAGKQVTYLNFPDEGHGIRRPHNRDANFAVTETFLAQCLGGRSEQIGDSLDGSSLQIISGAAYVGLQDQKSSKRTPSSTSDLVSDVVQ